MNIPARIKGLLEKDSGLNGAVLSAIATFEPFIRTNKLAFFPEYTDHGLDHLEQVLATAEALITDRAFTHMTAADAAVLSLSVLLHDCAMHLTEESFASLIGGSYKQLKISQLDQKDWPALWEDFLAEAVRFDGRKLTSLFGENTPAKRPPLDPLSMTQRDRLLIGEFIRRHHARLAHEFAVFGIPGVEGRRVEFAPSVLQSHIGDLAGLVARSHGLNVRSLMPYLQKLYHPRDFHGVHAIFLMALLRVSDYLQVQAARAPNQLLHVRQLRSPISLREWNTHQAIANITYAHDDPEAIYIDARPADVATYLRLKHLLAGLQAEVDSSWAVLGEVYGRFSPLDELGLLLRRVRSNLDEPTEFRKTVSFAPRAAAFETSDPDLLKLLIQPLYGDNPEIGVRELIQNAVDAVRELAELRKHRPILEPSPALDQASDVVVTLQKTENGGRITVSDKGTGMTEDTICDYFLKAGASFRKSSAWKKAFEDESGKSKVQRSGRFGIGALAAFLLGERISVKTRHVDSSYGIEFSTTLDAASIQLDINANLPVGTTIAIELAPSVYDRLRDAPWAWDWYCLSSPSVSRVSLDGKQPRIIKQTKNLPNPGESLPPAWHRISSPDFPEVTWSYALYADLVCNGILIGEQARFHSSETRLEHIYVSPAFPIRPPFQSICDPDGYLPLNCKGQV
jgi:molecular chaperone HtpG